MIFLSYYHLKSNFPIERFSDLLMELPVFMQNKINSFRNRKDAERSLMGNIMLVRLLAYAGLTAYSLNQVRYTEYNKPYFDDFISYNISHSGDYVVCALSKIHEVGIDIEEIKGIAMDDFNGLFAGIEWNEVLKSENKLHAFYTLWTKKEAFLKAIGCGLNQPLNEVVIENNTIIWKNKQWFLHEIILDKHHLAWLCCNNSSPVLSIIDIRV